MKINRIPYENACRTGVRNFPIVWNDWKEEIEMLMVNIEKKCELEE